MAITDPRAVKISKEKIRTLADTFSRSRAVLASVMSQITTQGILNLVPDDETEMFVDGSPEDGRPPLSGAAFHRTLEAFKAVAVAMDAPAKNGKTHAENVLAISPNPTPRTTGDL